ncbi:hypothetical protein Tco_0161146, partial [Tanacetum coccineum]
NVAPLFDSMLVQPTEDEGDTLERQTSEPQPIPSSPHLRGLGSKRRSEKHVGGKKHYDLKTKSFEEIKALYDKIKRSDDSFIAIGSAEDEKVIKEMNEQVADASKKRLEKDDSIKGEIKEE